MCDWSKTWQVRYLESAFDWELEERSNPATKGHVEGVLTCGFVFLEPSVSDVVWVLVVVVDCVEHQLGFADSGWVLDKILGVFAEGFAEGCGERGKYAQHVFKVVLLVGVVEDALGFFGGYATTE